MVRPNFENVFFSILIIASLLVSYKYIYTFVVSDDYRAQKDLYSYLTAAHIIKSGEGHRLFDINTQNKYQRELYGFEFALPFKYPPFVALLFVPFAHIDPKTSYFIFFLLNTVFLFIGLKLIVPKNFRQENFVLLFLMLFTSPIFILLNLIGQFYAITLLLLALMYKCYQKNNLVGLGVLTALILIKPQMALILLFLTVIIKDKRSFLKGFFITGVILTVISLLVGGRDAIQDYILFIFFTEKPLYGSYVITMSNFFNLFTFIRLQSQFLFYVTNVFLVTLLLGLTFKKRLVNKDALFGVIVVFSTLTSPHTTSADNLILALICMISFFTSKTRIAKFYNLLIALFFFYTPSLIIAKIIDIKIEVLLILGIALAKLFETEVIKRLSHLSLKLPIRTNP